MPNRILHITSGDVAGDILKRSRIPGEVFVWHDILYEGPRNPGWPDESTLRARAQFIEEATGGGLGHQVILETLRTQYTKLEGGRDYDRIILWFDACLFDQSMLCHILTCLATKSLDTAELICVDAFPDIEPFDGLGQLSASQMASLYGERKRLTKDQFRFAEEVDEAFALQDQETFVRLSHVSNALLPWVCPAVARWLEEQPDAITGLGRLEQLIMDALYSGLRNPSEIFAFVAAHDRHPVYWGDTTLWAKINRLATRKLPLVRIEGPKPLLPQWNAEETTQSFCIYPVLVS